MHNLFCRFSEILIWKVLVSGQMPADGHCLWLLLFTCALLSLPLISGPRPSAFMEHQPYCWKVLSTGEIGRDGTCPGRGGTQTEAFTGPGGGDRRCSHTSALLQPLLQPIQPPSIPGCPWSLLCPLSFDSYHPSFKP